MSHTVFTCRSEACCSAVSTLSYCTWPVTIGGSRDQSGLWPFLHICLSGWPLPPLHNQMTLLPDTIRVSDHILHSRRTILPYPIRVFFPFCTILALGTLLPDPIRGFLPILHNRRTLLPNTFSYSPILHSRRTLLPDPIRVYLPILHNRSTLLSGPVRVFLLNLNNRTTLVPDPIRVSLLILHNQRTLLPRNIIYWPQICLFSKF